MIQRLALAAAFAALLAPAASAAVVTYRFASDPISLTDPGSDDDLAGTISAVVRIDEAVSGPLTGASFFAARAGNRRPILTRAGRWRRWSRPRPVSTALRSFDASFFSTDNQFAGAQLQFATTGTRALTSMQFSIFLDTPDYVFGLDSVYLEAGTSGYEAAGTWTLAPIPLPAGLPLLAAGLGALGLLRWRAPAG